MVRQRSSQARTGKGRTAVARQRIRSPPIFLVTEWWRSSQPSHLLKQLYGKGLLKFAYTPPIIWRSKRQIDGHIASRLETVHPNPGPLERSGSPGSPHAGDDSADMSGLRRLLHPERAKKRRGRKSHKSREWRDDRRERRKEKRKQKRIMTEDEPGEIRIVTWNVQRASTRDHNRRRLRRIVDYISGKKWEIVLISELKADREGIIWMGDADDPMALIHSQKAGILLSGESLTKWTQQGQQKWYSERTTAVKIDNMRLIAVYQPVWTGGQGLDTIEQYRVQVEEQINRSDNRQILIIGGDHNAHVGKDDCQPGTTGRFGLRASNDAGRDLINWCQSNGLAWVSSFYHQKQRGTWFNQVYGRWYELDGFIMRADQRHKHVRKVSSINEHSFSDHKPKSILLRLTRPWRHTGPARRPPQIRWERLRDIETAEQYELATRGAVEEAREAGALRDGHTNWDLLTELMTSCVKEMCGVRGRRSNNPWMVGREEEDQRLRGTISELITRRNTLMEGPRTRARERDLEEVRRSLKESRTLHKRTLRRWEREWWSTKIDECEEAYRMGNIGQMYRLLREISQATSKTAPPSSTITTEEFKDHFSALSAHRFERSPTDIETAVQRAVDLREDLLAKEYNELLNEIPQEEEILEAMKNVKDSAPGEDGIRMSYINHADIQVKMEIVRMIKVMFTTEPSNWEESLKIGHMVPIFKKGDRNIKGNYRGVVLLAMGSRILARIMASRIRWWAEKLGLLDENQAGFREGRSTADATQVITRIQEDISDYKRRRQLDPERSLVEPEVKMEARLLDLEKAYPRVNRPCLWKLLNRYGLNGRCLNTLVALHETTSYKIKGKGDVSSPWTPQRGLREGCPTSPILFNIFHQAVMRVAEGERSRRGGHQVGIPWTHMPGSSFPGRKLWEKESSETVETRFTCSLFADDTTILGEEEEMEEGVRIIKEVMAEFEEKNNDHKEERLKFGDLNDDNTRMLGCWMGAKTDIQQRKARAGKAWFQVKKQLFRSTLPRRTQARIIEACVEAALLFDCNTRVWYVREIKSLQSWIDRCYRRIWGRNTGPPLIQMQQQGVNMFDVREALGIKSIRYKIEKRILERIGHIIRMDDARLVKTAVLGWFKELEKWMKCPGRKRKTQLYWIKTMKDAGMDWAEVDRLAHDKAGWKSLIADRMKHLDLYERQRGNKYEWATGEQPVTRNATPIDNSELTGFPCRYEGCTKICLSKGGLTIHQRRMHQTPRKDFKCEKCEQIFASENTWKNHMKACSGGACLRPNYVICSICGREVGKNNLARHRRTCEARAGIAGRADEGGGQGEDVVTDPVEASNLAPRVYQPKTGVCDLCGRTLSLTNMARHRRRCGQRT